MANVKLEKDATSPVILVDDTKPTKAKLEAQGWTTSVRDVTQPVNGDRGI